MAAHDVGFLLPQFGALARPDTLRHVGAVAEELGYESVWAADHLVTPRTVTSPYPYNSRHVYPLPPDVDILEPFVPLAFLAATTTRLKLGFSVLILGYRHPVETAKLIASLDVMSSGRVLIGAGVGWMEEEFTALGIDFRERGRRADEVLDLWRLLWTSDDVHYDGEFYVVHDVVCRPRPVQAPRPPLTIGGHSEAAYRRMLRHDADGFQVVLDTADDAYGVHGTVRENIELLHRMAEAHGRDPATVEITGVFITTTAERFLEEVETYRALGMTRFILDFVGASGTIEGIEQTLEIVSDGLGLASTA